MEEIIVKVKKDEEKIFPFFWLGDKSREVKITAIMDQPGASLKILGVFYGKTGSLDLLTEVVHQAPNTFSRTIIKGVLDGDASANFEGLVRIEKGAKNADADLKEHSILISKQAKAIAIPRLDVLENEVKAGHGATVSKIDEEQIFYLMSRGLSLVQAKDIIIKGFLQSMVNEFPRAEAKLIAKKLFLDSNFVTQP